MRRSDPHTVPILLSDTASDWRVVDDLADLPVTAAELDAIEAFLRAELRAVLDGNDSPQQKESGPDSQLPESHVALAPRVRRRRMAR